MEKKFKIIIAIAVVVIVAIVGMVVFISKSKTNAPAKQSKQDILLDMVKSELEKNFKTYEEDFKEIEFVKSATIETNENIVTIYGSAGYKDLYGNGSYSNFEGEFETNKDNVGNLLSITTKYLKFGPSVYVDKR